MFWPGLERPGVHRRNCLYTDSPSVQAGVGAQSGLHDPGRTTPFTWLGGRRVLVCYLGMGPLSCQRAGCLCNHHQITQFRVSSWQARDHIGIVVLPGLDLAPLPLSKLAADFNLRLLSVRHKAAEPSPDICPSIPRVSASSCVRASRPNSSQIESFRCASAGPA